MPTHPTVAPYHTQPYCQPFNFLYTGIINTLGFPAVHVPTGLSGRYKDDMPVGVQVRRKRKALSRTLLVQIVAGNHLDRLCLAVARELEVAFGGWRDPGEL